MSDTLTELRHLRGQMNALDKAKAEVGAKYHAAQTRLHAEMKAALVERFGKEYEGRLTFYEHLDHKTLPDYEVRLDIRV